LSLTLTEERTQRIARVEYDYAAQPITTIRTCNLCGYERFVVLVHRDRYGYPAQAHGCLRCGLVFLNPVMTSEAYRRFYASVYRPLVSAYHGRLIDADTIQQEQRDYAVERAGLLADFVSDAGATSLLDIGGSTGVVADYFARRFELSAAILDPSPDELERAARLGLETIAGFLEDFDPGSRRFDLVIMCQTIDHLQDIARALRKVRTLVSNQGIFYVDIVDFTAAYLRNDSVEEAVKVDHPYYLTQSTVASYLARAGFEILRVDYAADHLHIGYVCRPDQPKPDSLPGPADVALLWREVREIQNTHRAR
jgi:SAM-dependent methyltransferase